MNDRHAELDAALERVISAARDHLAAVKVADGRTDDDQVWRAYVELNNASFEYDELLLDAFGEVTPWDVDAIDPDEADKQFAAGIEGGPGEDPHPRVVSVRQRRDYRVPSVTALLRLAESARQLAAAGDGEPAEPVESVGEALLELMQAGDGSGQISSNLVVRYAAPKDLLGSGHPDGGSLPENLGLMRSPDHGATWAPVSQLGKADFHILQAAQDRVVAVNADAKEIQISTDGGKTFASKTPPDTPVDVVFDAGDPKRMVVATKQGVFTSANEGGSWRARDPTQTQQLAWGAPDALYRADPGGSVKRSTDGGESWDEVGNVASPAVNELAIDAGGALYASVPGGEVKRSTDGGATWVRLVKLK